MRAITRLLLWVGIGALSASAYAESRLAPSWRIDYATFLRLPKAQQVDVLKAYRDVLGQASRRAPDFLVEIQSTEPFFRVLSEAIAGELPPGNCFLAGWASSLAATAAGPRCTLASVQKDSAYQEAAKGCKASEMACNPVVFGDGVCVGIATPEQRQSAYQSCGSKGKSPEEVVALLRSNPEKYRPLFEHLRESVQSVCPTGSGKRQSGNAMCRSLVRRVGQILQVAKVSESEGAPDVSATAPTTTAPPASAAAPPSAAAVMEKMKDLHEAEQSRSKADLPALLGCFTALEKIYPSNAGYPDGFLIVPGLAAQGGKMTKGVYAYRMEQTPQGPRENVRFHPTLPSDPNSPALNGYYSTQFFVERDRDAKTHSEKINRLFNSGTVALDEAARGSFVQYLTERMDLIGDDLYVTEYLAVALPLVLDRLEKDPEVEKLLTDFWKERIPAGRTMSASDYQALKDLRARRKQATTETPPTDAEKALIDKLVLAMNMALPDLGNMGEKIEELPFPQFPEFKLNPETIAHMKTECQKVKGDERFVQIVGEVSERLLEGLKKFRGEAPADDSGADPKKAQPAAGAR